MAGANSSTTISATATGSGDGKNLKEPSVFVNENDLGYDIESGPTPSSVSVNDGAGHRPTGSTDNGHGVITRTTDFRVDVEKGGEKAELLK